jgi:[ribosomal protein S5]-alanine N-acetyltransferase
MGEPVVPEPRILTPRLVLRPLRESDRNEFKRVQRVSLAHLRPWSPRSDLPTDSDAFFERALARASAESAARTDVRLIAEFRGVDAPPAGTIVGGFNLNNLVRGVAQKADAGWWLSAEAIGRGLASEGVTALLGYAFAAPGPGGADGLGLHRVACAVIPDNAPSLRVAERCGFRREGLAIKMIQIDGAWRDHVLFAKLAEEHTPPPSR